MSPSLTPATIIILVVRVIPALALDFRELSRAAVKDPPLGVVAVHQFRLVTFASNFTQPQPLAQIRIKVFLYQVKLNRP